MLVNRISNCNNFYNYYSNQRSNIKAKSVQNNTVLSVLPSNYSSAWALGRSNVVAFRSKYEPNENFEFLNETNLNEVTQLFCDYRKNAGQKNISFEKSKEFIAKYINNPEHKILTMKDEGEYAGFLMFSKTHSTIDLQPFFVIDALFVSPEHRGKKLSNKMVEELKEYTKYNNYKGIHVKTWANNVISNKLYQGTNFNNETLKYTTYFWANNNIFNYKDKYMSDEYTKDKK